MKEKGKAILNQKRKGKFKMGGHSCGGLFKGTSGEKSTSTALALGNAFRENLQDVMALVPLSKEGYFGIPSKRKGSKGVRIVECSDPAKNAFEFQRFAGRNSVSIRTIPGKGHIMTMRDGTIIKYRMFSSSSDGSPVVELEISGLKRVKSQKIHFVKRSDND